MADTGGRDRRGDLCGVDGRAGHHGLAQRRHAVGGRGLQGTVFPAGAGAIHAGVAVGGRLRAGAGDAAADPRSWRLPLAVALILGVLPAMLVYWPILTHGFAYEDPTPLEVWRWPADWLPPTRWLSTVTWIGSAATAHAFSLTVHAVNGALAGWWAHRLGVRAWWVVMGLVLLHPMQSEAVAYAVCRGELLTTMGALLVALAFTAQLWSVHAAGVLVGVALASVSKESGVWVIGLVLVLAWTRRRWSLAAIGVLGTAAWVLVATWPRMMGISAHESGGTSIWRWAGLMSVAIWRNLRLTVCPVGLSVAHDPYSVSTSAQIVAIWLLLLAVAGVVTWVWRRRSSVGALGAGWVLASVLPRFAIRTSGSVLPEHHWYGPLVGLALVAGWWMSDTREGVSTDA